MSIAISKDLRSRSEQTCQFAPKRESDYIARELRYHGINAQSWTLLPKAEMYADAIAEFDRFDEIGFPSAAPAVLISPLDEQELIDIMSRLSIDDDYILYRCQLENVSPDAMKEMLSERPDDKVVAVVRRMREDACKGIDMTAEYLDTLKEAVRNGDLDNA